MNAPDDDDYPTPDTQDIPGSARVAAILPRGTCLSRYVILDMIGEGGMSVVYRAYDPDLDRPIAIKLLRNGAKDGAAAGQRERLMREAQALAKLAHPHIVSIYDVGTFGSEVFIAMELVEGRLLRRWLKERPRTQKEILDVFCAAGDGLASAHRAGLVHRDFKPENVIVGNDGRTRVFDFGLVRTEQEEAAGASAPSSESAPSAPLSAAVSEGAAAAPTPNGRSTVPTTTEETLVASTPDPFAATRTLHTKLTLDGSIVGTPSYMSPEQHEGAAIDARSDQFSYCVALYEALYGTRPFDGNNLRELADNVRSGRLTSPPSNGRVPRWLRQALVRGMAPAPAARHESMDALLRLLRRDSRQARRRWLLALGATLMTATMAVGYGALRRQQLGLCRGADGKLAGVWDARRRADIEAAFKATGLGFAPDALRAVSETLDGYAAAWATMRTEACETTRLHGEQSETLLDLRMQCLDQRLGDLKADVELFASADAKIVEKAVQVAQSLPPLSACADAAALRAPPPPPSLPSARGRIEQLRGQLSRARALMNAGNYVESEKLARDAVDGSRPLAWAPLEAEAALMLGQAQELAGDYKVAEKTLRDATALALGGRRDDVAADMWISLVQIIGDRDGRYAEAHQWARMAEALIGRLSDDPARLGTLFMHEGNVFQREGKYDEALVYCERALPLITRAYGPGKIRTSESLNNIGNVFYMKGKLDEARQYYERSRAIKEKLLGPQHPQTALTLANLANVDADMGNHARAVDGYEKALAVEERSLGPQHPSLAVVLDNMGGELTALGRLDEALAAHQRAATILEKAFGPRHPQVADAVRNIGEVYRRQHRFAEALTQFQRALAIHEATQGAAHPSVAADLSAMGDALLELGRLDEALSYQKRALAIWQKALGPQHMLLAKALYGIGAVELAQRRAAEALAPLESAVTLHIANPGDALEGANARFALATALWLSGGDRARARALAEQARSALSTVTDQDGKRKLADIVAWQEKH